MQNIKKKETILFGTTLDGRKVGIKVFFLELPWMECCDKRASFLDLPWVEGRF